jgi:chorismate-pyruvate lyase
MFTKESDFMNPTATFTNTHYPSKLKGLDRLDLSNLNLVQRILMLTDGTVTELLEFLVQESIAVTKLTHQVSRYPDDLCSEHVRHIHPDDLPALNRRILLTGQSSRRHFLYAESTILPQHLPAEFRDDLLHTNAPIGKLWAKHRLETFKADYLIARSPASEELAAHLKVPVNSDVLSRTYQVWCNGHVSMVITEKFSLQEAFQT